jgi:hypothetical protein
MRDHISRGLLAESNNYHHQHRHNHQQSQPVHLQADPSLPLEQQPHQVHEVRLFPSP